MITLVVGGARSGKSTYAESLYKDKTDVVYIATSRIEDPEMQDRVNLHQASRPSSWRTFEGTYQLSDAIQTETNYLLDCLTILTSNIMFDISKDSSVITCEMQQEIENAAMNTLHELFQIIRDKDLNLVLVTNEVGCSIVPEHHISRVYRDIIGRVNQQVAACANEVYALICGIPVKIK